MLVAARVLAQDGKTEAAIACTKQVRALASTRSALPDGFSGVASSVTHEAFKFEVSLHENQEDRLSAVIAIILGRLPLTAID